MNGYSLLSVAGWWVAWVYALSLSAPFLLGTVDIDTSEDFDTAFANWAREVVFASPGLTVNASNPAGLADLKAIANRPAPVAGNVRMRVEPMTAREGDDYAVIDRGAEIHFDKGAVEGRLRFREDWGPDIRIIDPKAWKAARSFRLRLQSGRDAVAAGDLAMCTVTIDDGPQPTDLRLTPARFASASIQVSRDKLLATAIPVNVDAVVAEPVKMSFKLFETRDGSRRPCGAFETVLPTGERRSTFRLADALTVEDIQRLGLADDDLPGVDETYEIDLMAPPPLFPDTPRTCEIRVTSTATPPTPRVVYFDSRRREIDWLDPEGFITIEYDGKPLRNHSKHRIAIDGVPLPQEVVVEARCQRGDLVPLSGHDWSGRSGRRCNVSSACGAGCCKGQAGASGTAVCGEPIPGDYMLIVVNNERLHDPGDEIINEVRRALQDESAKPYGNGAIILNPEDEDVLTASSGGPNPTKMFKPFAEEGHSISGQLDRIEAVVARKREAAANPDLRAVVVWPDRSLAASAGVRRVGGDAIRPMSILLPGADASYARSVERSLVASSVQESELTVRAPREDELLEHLTNVILEDVAEDGSATQ